MVNPIFADFERKKYKNSYYLKLLRYGNCFERIAGKYQTAHYHRPIGYYINLLVNNGFYITNYEEVATKYFREKLIEDKIFFDFIQEFPSFLIVKATKKD